MNFGDEYGQKLYKGLMNSGVPVCLEVAQDYRPKAEYSISMLLAPLSLGPVFTSRSELGQGGIYYGHHPSGLPSQVTVLPMSSAAEIYFDDVTLKDINTIKWETQSGVRFPVLFSSKFGHDLVASAFYWLSGWQEYTIPSRDQHGRFAHQSSLQALLDVTHLPVVDCYRAVLQETLKRGGIHTQLRTWAGKDWAFCPTIDVDYLRHWRPGMVFRENVEYFFLNHRNVSFRERWRRLVRVIKSYFTPGDAFQTALCKMHQLLRIHGRATIFLKTAAHGPNDVAYRLDQNYVRELLCELASDEFEIGLHPSYHAHTHPGYLQNERRRLMDLTKAGAVSVRQHYLRYEQMITPGIQAKAGFRIDSSLGFAECSGFRNGTCMPFLKFDCYKNKVMNLWEMPLILMDGALFNRQNYQSGEAIQESKKLLRLCQQFGGVGVALWHNVIGEEIDYEGWEEHFRQTVQWSHEQGAYISSLKDALASWIGYPVE